MSFLSQNQIDEIVNIALKAGKISQEFFVTKDFEVDRKSDGSKVTTADIHVSSFVHENLSKTFPGLPIICEEGSFRELENHDAFFLIDPIDGTSNFIKGQGEFCLNIALIKNKKPVFGLIYAPMFEGGKIAFSDANKNIICGLKHERTIIKHSATTQETLRIVASSRSKEEDVVRFINQSFPQYSNNFVIERLGAATKFFRLIENQADIYLNFGETMEWDIAAGQFLIEVLGGKVKKLSFTDEKINIGHDLDYKKSDFLNPALISFIKEV